MDIESPWPLAEIVYQHHERMDDSGYPRNLKGDDILMETCILKGVLYDDAVADACLKLFREKGFQIEKTGFQAVIVYQLYIDRQNQLFYTPTVKK